MQIGKFRNRNVLVTHLMGRGRCGEDLHEYFMYVQFVVLVQEPREHNVL